MAIRIVPQALLFLISLSAVAACADFEEDRARNWHHWRGPFADGVAPEGNPPLRWSDRHNIRWKVPVEGAGNGTPIIWNQQVLLLTAIDTARVDPTLTPPSQQPDRPFGIKYPNTIYQFVVLCLDRKTGKTLWRRVARERVPNEGHHHDNSFASASPTTDGERVFAWFGSAGLYCYRLDGEFLWKRDLGDAETRRSFGEASSPVVHRDRLVLVRDQEQESYIEVFSTTTGETIWRRSRDEPSTWATPLVVDYAGTAQVITNGKKRVRSYALQDGQLLWECGGQASNVTPSPVTNGETVFCMSGYQGAAVFAIPLDSSGDISGTDKIRWSKSRGTPYVPSPLLYDGFLYYNQSNNNLLSCVDAATGTFFIDRKRLSGIRRIYASPVGAADRVYIVGRDGTTLVIAKGPKFKELARNHIGEPIDASPAIAGNQLFLRSKSNLFCIAGN